MSQDPGVRVKRDMEKQADFRKAEMISRYVKASGLRYLGLNLPQIHNAVREHTRSLQPEELPAVMEYLWELGVYEARLAAIDVMKSYAAKGDIRSSLSIISSWIDEVNTWALMDPLGTACVGTLLVRDQSLEKTLRVWAKSDNFWRRRASILPYLHLSIKEFHRAEYTGRILAAMKPHLSDREFFVGKAVGWVLRELSKRDPDSVKRFIIENRDTMTPLVARESSKKLK
ncbi:MAG: hypothetical protein C4K49_00215 [Candidatus Thorarchaeota archaeon]|nr:MAG: hypothetical protein C4K49_00215 [Candidatus Thorarchaeota archaeon]